MAYISFQPKDYFNTILNTGDGTTNKSFTGVGFQPDLVWNKIRSTTYGHWLYDAVRGAGAEKEISSNTTTAEGGNDNETYGYISSFDSDGFSVTGSSNSAYFNQNSETYVNWNWKANGAGSSNTDGSITSTVSASTTSGMSIIQYSGNGTAGATIGHGLGVAPKCVIIKRTDTTSNWIFGTGARGFDKFLYLNTTDAETTNSGTFNNTAPSSSVITLGSWNDVNNASGTYIAYCFADVQGFSKVGGSYVGNGSTDGSFIYLGMRSSFIMIKRTDAVSDWFMYDVTRDPLNPNTFALRASGTNAEVDDVGYSEHDHLSNGIKLRQTWDGLNASGGTYIYMAFSDQSIVSSNGVPATAR